MAEQQRFSKEQLRDFRDSFNLFDTGKSGAIQSADLGKVLRSLGQNPTEATLRQLQDEHNASSGGKVTFDGEPYPLYFFQSYIQMVEKMLVISPTRSSELVTLTSSSANLPLVYEIST